MTLQEFSQIALDMCIKYGCQASDVQLRLVGRTNIGKRASLGVVTLQLVRAITEDNEEFRLLIASDEDYVKDAQFMDDFPCGGDV